MNSTEGQFIIGQVVRHVLFDYRGVIFDVDPCLMKLIVTSLLLDFLFVFTDSAR